jgi:hypothetical protein
MSGLSGRDEAAAGMSVLDAGDWTGSEHRKRRRRRRLIAALTIAFVAAATPLLLYFEISALGPAIRAGHDQGIRGTFTAQRYDCGRAYCEWRGVFVADHGRTRVDDVGYDGGLPGGGHQGISVPALYSGDPATVYPIGGSNAWIGILLELIATAAVAVLVTGLFVWWELAARSMERSLAKPLTDQQREQIRRMIEERDLGYELRHDWQRTNPVLRSRGLRGPGRHTPH